jgi:2-polyprenyl-3-methyl-5-hydroxy-6-metoxy-1,4-benzoquinol methylase
MGFFLRDQGALASTGKPAVEWEEVNCLLCDSPRWSILVEAPDRNPAGAGLWFPVVQCQQCGLCFTNPRPSPLSIAHFYACDYRPHRSRGKRTARRWWHRFQLWQRHSRKVRQALSLHGRGSLLDFGCGSGSFLERMRRLGWEVTGLDTSAAAVQRVRQELGLPALAGSLPHAGLPPESFDVITMWQSLEHVHRPLRVLRDAHRLLVPGGKLLVSVPNIDSLPFRWFGQTWYGLDLPRHLTHFTPPTLRAMLEHAGFRINTLQLIRHSSWLRSSAELASRHCRSPGWRRWLGTRVGSNLAAWYCYLTRQGDCIQVTATKRAHPETDSSSE